MRVRCVLLLWIICESEYWFGAVEKQGRAMWMERQTINKPNFYIRMEHKHTQHKEILRSDMRRRFIVFHKTGIEYSHNINTK